MSRVLPILFNTEMIHAILDGRKTVTRRVIKNLDIEENNGMITLCERNVEDAFCIAPVEYAKKEMLGYCQYQPGDILYVRETVWQKVGHTLDIDGETKAVFLNDFRHCATNEKPEDGLNSVWVKRPSIHMPKEAARIWLKVTDVRVERLQEMTASESAKEGIRLSKEYDTKERAYILGFSELWDSTLKKSDLDRYGWNANPWVWVIEFERCEKEDGDVKC